MDILYIIYGHLSGEKVVNTSVARFKNKYDACLSNISMSS